MQSRLLVLGIALLLLAVVGAVLFPVPMAHVQLPAEVLFTVAGIPITNTMTATWLTMLVLVAFFWRATARLDLVPGRWQNLAEVIIEALLNLVEIVAGPQMGRRVFALVATIFLFVLTANWLGLLPGFGTIGLWHEGPHHERILVPLFRSANTDLNTTLALAIASVLATQYYGISTLGWGAYLSRFFNIRGGIIGLFVGLLEFISELAKFVSFSFRLFGNIFAGEVLLAVIAFLIPWVAVVPFLGLELFVGFIQAFIFAMLTLVFVTVATTHHGGEEAREEHHH